MKKIYILPILAAALLSTGCSKETPFDGEESRSEGKFLKSALSMDINGDEILHKNIHTRADVNVDDFTVIFTKSGQTTPAAKYKFGEMPEVVVLPVGTYTCTATYGEDRAAEWENPYFLGASEPFEISAYEITSYIDPIECQLSNVKVSIDFAPSLAAAMSADSYVEVKVGSADALKFTSVEAQSGKAGYFKYSSETTLVATFHGNVDGAPTVETKSYSNILNGHHYKVTFKLHSHDGDPTGSASADVTIDASVVVTDVERNVEVGEEELLDDTERPREDGGDTPSGNEDKQPTITAQAPVNIDIVNNGNSLTSCVLDIHSYAEGGIIEFTCDIDSPTLTPEELAGVGLAAHLDLVNTPDDLAGPLSGLGFPVRVGGQKDVQFVLTNFLPMLEALGESEHHFVLTVKDANGTCAKTLKIKY